MDELISIGAEAEIYRKEDKLVKKRVKKNYRLKIIDEELRSSRTKSEARLLRKAKRSGISVPRIFRKDKYKIVMEYVDGDLLRDSLDNYEKEKREKICRNIGKIILKMHENNIVHGDLTTSNMILKDNKLFLIDFGLSEYSTRIEDKAVDLHLIKQALIAKHNKNWKNYWKNILEKYDNKKVLTRLKKVEERGRKK